MAFNTVGKYYFQIQFLWSVYFLLHITIKKNIYISEVSDILTYRLVSLRQTWCMSESKVRSLTVHSGLNCSSWLKRVLPVSCTRSRLVNLSADNCHISSSVYDQSILSSSPVPLGLNYSFSLKKAANLKLNIQMS